MIRNLIPGFLALPIVVSDLVQPLRAQARECGNRRVQNGDFVLHAISLGHGDPVTLIHGLPQHAPILHDTMEQLVTDGFHSDP